MQTGSLKPLQGMRILVTRPKPHAEALSAKLRSLGAVPIELPTIEITPLHDTSQLDAAIARLSDYDWVVFTSVHGVEFFLKRMSALHSPFSNLKSRKVAAIGPYTGQPLSEAGKEPDYVPNEFLSNRIVDGMGEIKGKRILLPRADIASETLPSSMREKGAEVEEVAGYQTIIPSQLSAEKIKLVFKEGVELVTFTSPSTIRYLSRVLGAEELRKILHHTRVACIGPVTAEAAKEIGVTADLVATTHTVDGLIEVIVNDRTL